MGWSNRTDARRCPERIALCFQQLNGCWNRLHNPNSNGSVASAAGPFGLFSQFSEGFVKMPAGDYQKGRTHCPQGHEYVAENTYTFKGGRHCKKCKRERTRVLRLDPERRKRYTETQTARRSLSRTLRRGAGELRRQKREWIATVKTKCAHCSEMHFACLDFHHRDPATKEHNVSLMMSKSWSLERLQLEVAKCDVLCSNCHRKLHWKNRGR